MSAAPTFGQTPDQLVGMKWKAIVFGKRTLNGTIYQFEHEGNIVAAKDDATIYTAIGSCAKNLAKANAEMLYPLCVTIAVYDSNLVTEAK